MKSEDWKLFLQRCWHHLIRACRSSDYVVATEAAQMLSSQSEFIELGKENRISLGGHIAYGSAFLCLLVNHGDSKDARDKPERFAGCLNGLVLCDFHSAEEFFHTPRPHDAGRVTTPLISLLGTSVSGDAAALLASCLRLAKPDELSDVINQMISRPEIESYSLGLKLVITMATSAEGKKTLWTLVKIYNRAIEIGNKVFDFKDKHHFETLKLVSHAVLTHLMAAPIRGSGFIDSDERRLSYENSLPLLLKLAWANDGQTASYSCGALALLANANLVHYRASEDILRLIELPAALGVTEQAAVTLCNIAHYNPSQNEHDTLLFISRCAKTLAIRARNRCEHSVQKHLARTMLYVSEEYKATMSTHHMKNGSLVNVAKSLLEPLGRQEQICGHAGAIEDVIRCIWNIGTKDRDILRPLIESGAIEIMLEICKRSLPSVEKLHRRRRRRRYRGQKEQKEQSNNSSNSSRKSQQATTRKATSQNRRSQDHTSQDRTQDERFVMSSLGMLFLLSTAEADMPELAVKHLTWLFPLTFELIRVDGPSRTLVLSLLHSVLSNCRLAKDQSLLNSWSENTKLVSHLLEVAHGQNETSNTFTRLQAVAILEHLDVSATVKSKNGGVTYIDTMVTMLRSRDFLASGDAAGLLSRWALLPTLKKVLLKLNCGHHAVLVVLRATKIIEKMQATSTKQ